MKKIVSVFIALILMFSCVTITSAAGINKYERGVLKILSSKVTVKGQTYKFPISHVNQAENYFLTINMTKSQYDKIIPILNNCYKLIYANKSQLTGQKGTISFSKMSNAVKLKLLDYSIKAGRILGLNVAYNCISLIITQRGTNRTVFDGKPIIKVTGVTTASDKTNNPLVSLSMLASLIAMGSFSYLYYRKRTVVLK